MAIKFKGEGAPSKPSPVIHRNEVNRVEKNISPPAHEDALYGESPAMAMLEPVRRHNAKRRADLGLCPECGQKIKPPPLTAAERQRRYRERKKRDG